MWDVKAEGGPDRRETFDSDLIDLGGIDLSRLSTLPGSVLRAAVQRVCAELAGDGETLVYFQSSLRGGTSQEDEAQQRREILDWTPSAAIDGDQDENVRIAQLAQNNSKFADGGGAH